MADSVSDAGKRPVQMKKQGMKQYTGVAMQFTMVLNTGDRKQMRSRSDSERDGAAPGGALYQNGLSLETSIWNGPCMQPTTLNTTDVGTLYKPTLVIVYDLQV